jgi:murein DD-endopeptidase MepM/ murein hydrolase activator NlpD
MTRLGWWILALIVLGVGGFAMLLSFGSAPTTVAGPVTQERHDDGTMLVPVAGVARGALTDSWGDPRGGGTRGHHGIDIMAPRGTPVVAAAAGRIEKLHDSVPGGTTIYQRSADGAWTYYYAHLMAYAPGLREGQAVSAGEPIAFVGDTGDAGAGNFHLHFGITRMAPGDRWWQGEDVNPYPLLARAGPTR